MMHPAFSYSCITLDKIRDMAKRWWQLSWCQKCLKKQLLAPLSAL